MDEITEEVRLRMWSECHLGMQQLMDVMKKNCVRRAKHSTTANNWDRIMLVFLYNHTCHDFDLKRLPATRFQAQ